MLFHSLYTHKHFLILGSSLLLVGNGLYLDELFLPYLGTWLASAMMLHLHCRAREEVLVLMQVTHSKG